MSVRSRVHILGPPQGLKPTGTQLVETVEGQIWVFLYGPKVCLAQTGLGSAACASNSLARSRGVVLGTFSPPTKAVPRLHEFLVIGLMPDDVRSVTATVGRKGQKRYVRVPVRHNVFAISAERPVLVRSVTRE